MTETKENNSLVKSIVFSLLIMVGGAVLWGVLYSLSIFAAWIAWLSTTLAMSVFVKNGGKADWKAFVWILVASLVLNILSIFITLAIIAANSAGVSFGQGFSLVFELMEILPELASAVIKDVALCILFTVIGASITFAVYKKKATETTSKQNKAPVEKTVEKPAVSVVEVEAPKVEEIKPQETVEVEPKVEENVIIRDENSSLDMIIGDVQAAVKNYIDNNDRAAFDKSISEIKTKYKKILESVDGEFLKFRAEKIKAQDNSNCKEREIACDIIIKHF